MARIIINNVFHNSASNLIIGGNATNIMCCSSVISRRYQSFEKGQDKLDLTINKSITQIDIDRSGSSISIKLAKLSSGSISNFDDRIEEVNKKYEEWESKDNTNSLIS